jgi:hypothetical protein
MKSKLYPTVVLVGISLSGTGAGCFGQSSQSKGAMDEPEGIAGADGTGSGGAAGGGRSGAGTAGSASKGGSTGSAGAGAASSSATGGDGTMVSAGKGSGGDSGSGASAGIGDDDTGASAGAGDDTPDGGSVDGGIMDAGQDAPVDPFCDTAWPTTKGNPIPPPPCEEQLECGGVAADAGWRRWLVCRGRLGDYQCDFNYVTSECEDGAWRCPDDAMPDTDCRCFGETPVGRICTEQGFEDLDAGAGGSG